MRIGLYLDGADVPLSEADEIEAMLVQDSGSVGYNKSGGSIRPWINGTYYFDVYMNLLTSGRVEVKFRTIKNGITSEWYSQVAFYKQ